MSASCRNIDVRMNLSLDDIIEQERKKSERIRQTNLAALNTQNAGPSEVEIMHVDEELLYDDIDDNPSNDIKIEIKNEPVENKKSDTEKKKWIQRPLLIRSRINNDSNYYKNKIRQTHRGRNNRKRPQSNVNFTGPTFANRNAHIRRKRPYIPQQRFLQNQRKIKKPVITGKQWTYLQHLRRLRNAQGFFLLGQNPARRSFWSSTPNGSFIYPLTRNVLSQFNSHHGTRAKGFSLGSSASGITITSKNSRRSAGIGTANSSRRSLNSFKLNVSNHSSVLDPVVAGEIAQIQSCFENDPEYDDLVSQNRKPVENLRNEFTNLSLTSRFSNYYLSNEE